MVRALDSKSIAGSIPAPAKSPSSPSGAAFGTMTQRKPGGVWKYGVLTPPLFSRYSPHSGDQVPKVLKNITFIDKCTPVTLPNYPSDSGPSPGLVPVYRVQLLPTTVGE